MLFVECLLNLFIYDTEKSFSIQEISYTTNHTLKYTHIIHLFLSQEADSYEELGFSCLKFTAAIEEGERSLAMLRPLSEE